MKFIRSRVPLWAGAKISAFKMTFQLTFFPMVFVQNIHLKWKLETRNYLVQVLLCKNEKPLAQVETSPGSRHRPLESWDPVSWLAPCPGLLLLHHSALYRVGPKNCAKIPGRCCTQFIQQEGAVCFYCKTCLLAALHFGSRGIKQALQASKLQHLLICKWEKFSEPSSFTPPDFLNHT